MPGEKNCSHFYYEAWAMGFKNDLELNLTALSNQLYNKWSDSQFELPSYYVAVYQPQL